MLIRTKFDGYSKDGIRLYPCDDGGGGGGGGNPNTTVTKELPDYAKPFAKETLGVGSSLGFTRDADGKITGFQPYQQYQGERNAQFTPLQQRSFAGARDMGPSASTTQAQGIAGIAANRALNMGYDTGQFQNQFNTPDQYQAGQFVNQNVQAPQLNQYGMGPAERVINESFNRPGAAQDFMSPYMQNVVDIQQREAQRNADIAGTRRGSDAVKSGAFGGSRQAIMDAEAARNLATQKGDIQATGQQAAFQNAQQQFNAEQNARMQAAIANQGAGLTVGQQNLGAQLGIQQLGAGQNMQSQLANQQYGMDAQRMREQSRQFGAGQDMTAAQQRAQYGQSAQQLQEQSRQYGAGIGMQGIQSALAGAGQLGGLGSQEFNQRMDANMRQNQFGGQQQSQVQNQLNQQYENFLAEKRNPYTQVEFMSNLLRETPTGSTTSMYQAPPSFGSQVAGAGTALTGAYLSGRANGGVVYAAGGRVRKAAGLNELALTKMRG